MKQQKIFTKQVNSDDDSIEKEKRNYLKILQKDEKECYNTSKK